MKNHITCPIQQAVADVNHAFDWTGIREGEFKFGATDVQACGWDGESWQYVIGHGKTPTEAYEDLRKQTPTGAQRSAKLRADAAKLIAEADAIKADAPTIEFP